MLYSPQLVYTNYQPINTVDSQTAMPNPVPEMLQVALMPAGRRGSVARGTNLLQAARALGVELESICGGRQTCGKCQIVVHEGHDQKHALSSSAASLSAVTDTERAYAAKNPLPGRRLACACTVQADVLILVPPESQARKQIVAKAATERSINIVPAVRQVYVESIAPDMDDARGDWERLQVALAAQWGLTGLQLDVLVLPTLQPALRQGKECVTVTLWQEQQVLRVQPGYIEGAYGLAVDVGSTTVVAHLCNLRTGALLSTQSAMNPQVKYGEDLMSRVSYSMLDKQGLARMHSAIIRTLNQLAADAAVQAGIALHDICDMVLVANPVMHHIALNIDPVELGGAPFAVALNAALDLKARDLGLKLNPCAQLHVLPNIAGHVGADNVAAQLAEAPHRSDDLLLLIDVGTNAEIVLGNRQQVLACSSPTGPAFEGAQIAHGQRAAPGAIERVRIDPVTLQPSYKVCGSDTWVLPGSGQAVPQDARATGICGSGIIEAVAELFLAGVISKDGRFNSALAATQPRVHASGRQVEFVLADGADTSTGSNITVTQNDVRAIQLGKAALYAGVKLLMEHRGVTQVDRIVLAGAFGSYISPRHAMILGLIPDCDLQKVSAVGNAAGDGARIALLNRDARLEAAQIAHNVQHVQTAVAPRFQEEFIGAMALPHATDAFPHLAGMLPLEPAAGSVPAERAPRRRRPAAA